MKSNTYYHAQRELDILVKSATDPDDRPLIEPFIPEILSLAEKFGTSGQSGGSAPMVVTAISQAIKTLLFREPICPITGIDDEWIDVAASGDGTILYQNNRCSTIFKNADGKSWYLDAIVWKNQNGETWSGTAKLPTGYIVTDRQYIKSFPFTPKTFYIDVIEKEIKPDDFEFWIKDPEQLTRVFKYYDEYN